jgi:hypothetical protein
MSSSRDPSRLTVRTGASATVGVVTEGVDVHSALGVGIVAGDVPGDLGLGGLGGLLEGDGALDVGVTTDNSDCEERGSCQPLPPFTQVPMTRRLLPEYVEGANAGR